jgi:hypothetical protein
MADTKVLDTIIETQKVLVENQKVLAENQQRFAEVQKELLENQKKIQKELTETQRDLKVLAETQGVTTKCQETLIRLLDLKKNKRKAKGRKSKG